MLRRDDVDAVTICTPSGVHADGAVAALDAGKHVVVEKPIDITLAAADRIIDAEKRSGKTVAVISQHRFDRPPRRSSQAVRDGHLGTITSAIASHAWWRGQTYYDSGDWRGTWALDGGGAVMNQTVHTINLMITTLGTPVEVFAYTACLAHERIEVEDTAVAVVKFASGALGIIHGTTAAYPGLDASLRVFGSKGSAVITNDELIFLHAERRDRPGDRHGTRRPGATRSPTTTSWSRTSSGWAAAHRRQLADFVDAVATGRAPRVGTAEARTSLSVILAMYESAGVRSSLGCACERRPRLAVNPIAYWLAGGMPDRTTRTLGPAFAELAEIGYTAVKADVPDDMAAEDYLPWLASFGLEPALSLYSGAFADRATHAEQAEAARGSSRPGRRRSASGTA